MKPQQSLLISLFTAITMLISCVVTNTPQTQQRDIKGCTYGGKTVDPDKLCVQLNFKDNVKAEELIDKILEQVGLQRNFVVMECPGVDNCMAVTIERIPYIIYDNEFLKRFDTAHNFSNGKIMITDWVAASILAHEVGHHLNMHTLGMSGSRPKLELEADEFSGFVLQKMGASLAQAQKAMNSPIVSDKSSYSHPARTDRLAAIQKGWKKAGGKEKEEETNVKQIKAEIAQGKTYYYQDNYTKAFPLLYKHRHSPYFDSNTQVNLGYMYEKGHSVNKDYYEAVKWYRKAAQQDNVYGQAYLGDMYENGKGVEMDLYEAINWYQKAARQGNEFAQKALTRLRESW